MPPSVRTRRKPRRSTIGWQAIGYQVGEEVLNITGSSDNPFVPGCGRTLVVGEVGLAHEGSLALAHSFIDAIARAGADAVKFQTHMAEAESSAAEPWRRRFPSQDSSRFDYWKRTEFSERHWRELKEHADEAKIAFLSSAFSTEGVELLKRIGVSAWKVASGQVADIEMLEAILPTHLPVLISTGMSSLSEIDSLVQRFVKSGASVTVLQCTSMYPTPAKKVGLNVIPSFRARYPGCSVGLSDHSGTIYPALAATALGVDVIEVHITLSREMFNPDAEASVTTEELAQLVNGVRFIEQMNASPVDKDELAHDLEETRTIFMKSVVAARDLPSSKVLEEGDLAARKPGTGIPGARLPSLIGYRLRRSIGKNELLHENDLEPGFDEKETGS